MLEIGLILDNASSLSDAKVLALFPSHIKLKGLRHCTNAFTEMQKVEKLMWRIIDNRLLVLYLNSDSFFSGCSGFPPLLKNQHFQFPIWSGIQGPQVCQVYRLLSQSAGLNKVDLIWFYQTNDNNGNRSLFEHLAGFLSSVSPLWFLTNPWFVVD